MSEFAEFLVARIAEDEKAATSGWSYGSPSRVLIEAEAKRRVMVWHSQYNQDECGETHGREDQCPTLRALAAVYADHEDYDESWRP